MDTRRFSIKLKVALVTCLVSGLAFSVFFTLAYFEDAASERDHASALISQSHRIHEQAVVDTLTVMAEDAAVAAGFPPVQGILRARRAPGGIDPLDGSALALWRDRLETLFSSLLANRTGYTQVRFILPEGDWREVVRVDLREGEPYVVPAQDLQTKGREAYIRQLATHRDAAFYFSHVTRNREHGMVDGPPTLRIVHPVRDDAGAVVGLIIINASIAELILDPPKPTDFGRIYYYVENLPSTSVPLSPLDARFVLHAQGSSLRFDVSDIEGLTTNRLLPRDDGRMGLFINEVNPGISDLPFQLRVFTLIDMYGLLAPVNGALRANILNGLMVTFVAAVLAFLLTARMLRPFEQLLGEVRDSTASLRPLRASYPGNDEVSALAEGFARLTNDLIHETQRLDMVLEHAADGVLTLTDDGLIEAANPAAEAIFATRARLLVGKPIGRYLSTADAPLSLEALQGAASGFTPWPTPLNELIATNDDGDQLPVECSISFAAKEDTGRFIVMLRDSSVKKEAERQTAQLIDALQRSNAELDQFAYIASHDLKAPLRVINNAVMWLSEDLEPYLNDDTRESLDLLRNRATRMERLLNDLLQHSRIGRVATPDTKTTGSELAREIGDLLDVPDGIKIHFSEQFKSLLLRKLPLQTVLLNLVGNSIKHHDKAHGNVWVDVTSNADLYTFSVRDDGPGIEPAYHKKIFEVFQTLKSRDQMESSGMGLAFVKKHIEVVGGKVRVISDGKQGTIFEFTWPRRVDRQEDAA